MTEAVPSSTATTRQTEEAVGEQTREKAIRERAYQIWEVEGRPDGTELDHWLRAEAEVIAFGEDVRKR